MSTKLQALHERLKKAKRALETFERNERERLDHEARIRVRGLEAEIALLTSKGAA